MADFLIAAGGVFLGWMLRVVVSQPPPEDHFDVFGEVTEPMSNVTLREDAA